MTGKSSAINPQKAINKYPRSIFLIICTEFCERFSFCGLRTILSLYLRNVLLYQECEATIIYHIFIMTCYCIPIIGAIFADSFLGRFRTILYFSFVYALGNVMLSLGAAPPVHLPPVMTTMIGLALIAGGTGGIKPCVAAFGGDQFKMPQQQDLLQQFFSIFYFTINFGGFVGMMVTPILRKAVHCFGSDSCYALGFGAPAGLMILALVLFICGKPWYKIKSPKENIIVQFTKCAGHALIERINSEKKGKEHWLDYASDKYDCKLIQDMKTVLAILFLYIPLPLFWSLFDQQGSSWTFQASRTNNELMGIRMIPDQMQVINPAIVLILIPLFDNTVYPWLDRLSILKSPLQRMVTGGFIAALAFVASAILEFKLEETYPVLPGNQQSHVNFVNLLPCSVQVINPFNNIQILRPGQNHIFKNVVAGNGTRYMVNVIASYSCGRLYLVIPWKNVDVPVEEFQVEPLFITSIGNELEVFKVEPEQLQKSLSGRPKMRVVIVSEENWGKAIKLTIADSSRQTYTYYNEKSPVSVTPYFEMETGKFSYSINLKNGSTLFEGQSEVNLGGVYSLVVKEENSQIIFSKLFVMTSPNSIHMLWLVPQYLLISVGEVMFAIAGLQFSFTQAPKSMKTVTIAAWYLSVAIGNLVVIIVTQLHLFKSQANEFLLYAVLVFLDMILFLSMTTKYKFVGIEADDSTSLFNTNKDQNCPDNK